MTPRRPISIAILGLGPAGLAMIPFIEAHPAFRLAALCDLRADALSPFADRRDLARTTSLEDLCTLPDLDAVFIATPTWLHCPHAVAILSAGKHAIVEKPMALDAAGRLIDPFGGEQDLRDGLLRHVAPAFIEDPLRVLRVARFAARFAARGFRIDPATLALMRHIGESGELGHLVAERVWAETRRALEGREHRQEHQAG